MGSTAKRGQKFVEQRDGREGVDGGSSGQRFFPAGLQSALKIIAHPVRGVRVQAVHLGHLVTQALLGQDLRDAVFSHPGPVAVPEPVGRQAELDRKPTGERGALGDRLDSAASGGDECARAWRGRRPGGHRDARPCRRVGNDQPLRLTGPWGIPALAGRAEDPPGVIAVPTMTAVRAEEYVVSAAAVLRNAGAALPGLVLHLPGQQLGEERRQNSPAPRQRR